jgi:hypothetical protein
MKKYQVTGPMVQLFSGKVQLSPEQSGPRKHNLAQVKGNVFEITAPIQFKQGETFGYDGEISKAMALDLDEEAAVKKAAAEKEASEKAAREASEKVGGDKKDDEETGDGDEKKADDKPEDKPEEKKGVMSMFKGDGK